ncbi:MAG TPA: 4'-phosphopantetheinyl transferase superfamily protein [Bacteroidetes bacterium]|nr:4'-phosphopantetheinyl transferase superfamily protein [Bacteroidota bacterium]
MPLFYKEKKDNYSLIIWKVDEYLSFFLDKLDLYNEEVEEISGYSPHRLLEWASTRFLIYLLENKNARSCIVKDENGKPELLNSNKYISVSHSNDYAAAIISDKQIGLDIQKISAKAEIVKNKFLSKTELKYCINLIDFNCFWTVKEAVYKAYGKKNLIFKDNIAILNYDKINKTNFKSRVLLNKNDLSLYYSINGKIFDDFVMSIAVLN